MTERYGSGIMRYWSYYSCNHEAEWNRHGTGYKISRAHSPGTQLPPIRLNLLKVPQPSKTVAPARVLLKSEPPRDISDLNFNTHNGNDAFDRT